MSIGLLMMGGMGSGVVVFTPASLFAASEPGFWAPVTTARLWQDVARATPVTAVTQSVGSWELTTAAGVLYAEQATAAKRPTYQEASGKGYLDFDGVDDCLVIATLDLSAANKITTVSGVHKRTDNQRIICEHSANTNDNVGTFHVFTGGLSGGATRYSAISRGSAGVSISLGSETAASFTQPVTSVLTSLHDIAGDSTSLRVDGTASGTAGTGDKGTGNFGSYGFYIGQRGATGLAFDGRIYGMIIHGSLLSGTNLTDAETWMQGLVV